MKTNRIKLEDLIKMQLPKVAALDTETLAMLDEDLDEMAKSVKALSGILAVAKDLKFGEAHAKARQKAAKDTGVVHVEDGDFDISVDVTKKVEWDSEKLVGIFDEMDEQTAKHYAKVTLAVAEAKYTSAPPDIRTKLDAARTVKAGTPKYTIKRTEP